MLHINLEYYDQHHKKLLDQGVYKSLKTADRVERFRETAQISKGDFFNYFLIHRSKSPAYSSYINRISKISQAVAWVDGVLDTTTTIKSLPGCEELQVRVGEAVCLSIAGVMFELTAADWSIIPIQGGKEANKSFDFERTMTGITASDEVIQVEAKGSFVPDNNKKHQNVSAHSSSIAKKKVNIAKKGTAYKYPATARYGMIAAIDSINNAKCWLLDPPSEPFEGNARRFKAANRLEYIADMLSLLAPKARLPDALRRRATQWRSDDSTGPSAPIGTPYTAHNYVEKFLAKGKIWLSTHDIVGQLYLGKTGEIFFIGLSANVIRDAIIQDANLIAESHYDKSIARVKLNASPFDLGRHQKVEPLDVSLNLHITSSGTVIGIAGKKVTSE